HPLAGACGQPAVDEPLLAHQRRAHVGNDRDVVVVFERLRIHQEYARTLAIEPAHVDEAMIGAAPAAGAQDPGADRQRFDIVAVEISHGAPPCGVREPAPGTSVPGSGLLMRRAARRRAWT